MDSVFAASGHLGLFQLTVCLVPLTASMMSGLYILAPVYITFDPQHRCRLPAESPFSGNDTLESQSEQHAAEVARYIPLTGNGSRFDSCHLFVNGSTEPCQEWVHSTEDFESTLVTELGLYCSKKKLGTLMSTCSFAGVLAGIVVAGYIADWIGRRLSLLATLWLLAVALAASIFAVSPIYSALIRFLIGAGALSSVTVSYVMMVELVGPKSLHHATSATGYAWATGCLVVALLAFVTRSWRWFAIGSLVPTLLMLAAAHFPQLSPETPRWLASRGRSAEAAKVVKRMLRLNKAADQQQALDNFLLGAKSLSDSETGGANLTTRQSLLLLMRSPLLLLHYGITCFIWFVVAAVYYGIAMGAKNLPGNIFVTSSLLAATDFPAYLLLQSTAGRFGRKTLFVWFMGLSSLSLAALAAASYFAKDLQWLIIASSLVGRSLNSGAFGLIYMWTSELYPTNMRSSGLSSSSMCARLGTLFAPLLGNIRDFLPGDFGPIAVYLLFAGASCLSALIACAVPETMGRPMADTVHDIVGDSGNGGCGQQQPAEMSVDPLISKNSASA